MKPRVAGVPTAGRELADGAPPTLLLDREGFHLRVRRTRMDVPWGGTRGFRHESVGRLGRVVLCRLSPEAYARLLGDGREPPRWALEWERRAIGSDTIGLVHAPGRPRPLAALLEAVREEVAAGPLSPPASPGGNAGASAPSP